MTLQLLGWTQLEIFWRSNASDGTAENDRSYFKSQSKCKLRAQGWDSSRFSPHYIVGGGQPFDGGTKRRKKASSTTYIYELKVWILHFSFNIKFFEVQILANSNLKVLYAPTNRGYITPLTPPYPLVARPGEQDRHGPFHNPKCWSTWTTS